MPTDPGLPHGALLAGMVDALASAIPTSAGEFATIAASQSNQVLGATGAAGDYLEALTIIVATAATAQVQIRDDVGTQIIVFPNSPGGGIGSYYVPIKARSVAGPWKVTTGAGVSVIATGAFT